MSWKIEDKIRPNIRSLVPYSSARDDYSGTGSIFLDANESPYNRPLNRYPDPHQLELKSRISSMKRIEEDQIFLGNGSDEAIDLLFRIFCEPGKDNVLIMEPSYGMYDVAAHINDVEVKKIRLNNDFSLNANRFLEAVNEQTKLIFLCSPNNPTSNLLEQKAVIEILDAAVAMVVIDEAYIDFSGSEGFVPFLSQYNNLVVLQTLSKAWALAGIRLGLAMADPLVTGYLSRVKYPYNVNALTIQQALQDLSDTKIRGTWVSTIVEERKRLSAALSEISLVNKVYPSDANFLLIKVEHPRAIYNYLLGQGIIVRDRSNVPLCSGCLRITIGNQEENDKLIEVLQRKSKQDQL